MPRGTLRTGRLSSEGILANWQHSMVHTGGTCRISVLTTGLAVPFWLCSPLKAESFIQIPCQLQVFIQQRCKNVTFEHFKSLWQPIHHPQIWTIRNYFRAVTMSHLADWMINLSATCQTFTTGSFFIGEDLLVWNNMNIYIYICSLWINYQIKYQLDIVISRCCPITDKLYQHTVHVPIWKLFLT